jgi:hypothetical protein
MKTTALSQFIRLIIILALHYHSHGAEVKVLTPTPESRRISRMDRPSFLPEFMDGIEHPRLSELLIDSEYATPFHFFKRFPKDNEIIKSIGTMGGQIDARIIGEGTLIQSSSEGMGYFMYMVFLVKNPKTSLGMPISYAAETPELVVAIPGLYNFKEIEVIHDGHSVWTIARKSELKGSFDLVEDKDGRQRVVKTYPVDLNLDDARGTLKSGDDLLVLNRRMEGFAKVMPVNSLEGSPWSRFWKVGDGLVAFEIDDKNKSIKRMGYVLWFDTEKPVVIPLKEIHLEDGEMSLDIPPPPAKIDESNNMPLPE